jgi:CBS domain-containing protein
MFYFINMRNIFGGGRKSDGSQESAQEPDRRFLLAAIIVFAAFVLVGFMLAIQSYTVTTVISSGKSGSNLTSALTMVNQSNQTLFNTLLPVFGAWVGVVVVFYFGSKQAEKAQEALVKTTSSVEEKLVALKVQAILDKYPETQHPIRVKLTDQIKDVLAAFSNTLTDVLVVDKDDKPVGILYKSDLLSVLGVLSTTDRNKLANEGNDPDATTPLYEKLSSINNHLLIPERKWVVAGKPVVQSTLNKENSATDNFARVTPDDNLLLARERMVSVNKQINDVRCVVIDEASGQVRGIFGYDSILAFVKS